MKRVIAACGVMSAAFLASAAIHAYRLGIVSLDASGYLAFNHSAIGRLIGTSASPNRTEGIPSYIAPPTLVASLPTLPEVRSVVVEVAPKKRASKRREAAEPAESVTIVAVAPDGDPTSFDISDLPGIDGADCEAIRKEIEAAMKHAKVSSMTRKVVIRAIDASDLPAAWFRFEGEF